MISVSVAWRSPPPPSQKSDVASLLCVSIKRASRMGCKAKWGGEREESVFQDAHEKAGADWFLAFVGYTRHRLRDWHTTHSFFIFCHPLNLIHLTCFCSRAPAPRIQRYIRLLFAGSGFGLPSCAGELPCETRNGIRDHRRFLHVHLRGYCGFTTRAFRSNIRLFFDLLAFRRNFSEWLSSVTRSYKPAQGLYF